MKIKDAFHALKTNYSLRLYVLAICSFCANALFFCYNLFMGIAYKRIWNFSVCFYYLFLSIIKGILLLSEKKWKGLEENKAQEKRTKLFKRQSVFLLWIDVVLIAPVALLLLQQKAVPFGQIATIGLAAYTTYKIVMACIHITKVKKRANLSLQALKTISLKEALVSVITLQNTMVTVFGNPQQMLTLTFWTSLGLWGLILTTSIFSIVKAKKC